MTERPRSRRTQLVWWATVVAMAIIAVIFLFVTRPWYDPPPAKKHPHGTHHRAHSLGLRPVINADLLPNATATRR